MKIASAVALALVLAGPAGAQDVSERAPPISAVVDGRSVDLAALRGQVVLLDFWASWCGPCKQSFPWMNAMHAKYAAQGLRVIAVNVDRKREDGERFLAQVPAQFTIAWDAAGTTPAAYGVKAMPSSVLIGADGRIAMRHAGFRADDTAPLEAAIAAALEKRR